MVNLAFLRARRMAGPAIQRCLLVIHTIVTHSSTVVHITYYMANVAVPTSRERRRTHACSIYIAS